MQAQYVAAEYSHRPGSARIFGPQYSVHAPNGSSGSTLPGWANPSITLGRAFFLSDSAIKIAAEFF